MHIYAVQIRRKRLVLPVSLRSNLIKYLRIYMKRKFALLASTVLLGSVFACGCSLPFSGTNGRDGVDGKNATAYEYYELAKSVHGDDYTVEQFLNDYLNYTPAELEEAFSLQASVNRSLRSAVSVAAQFNNVYTSLGSGVIVDLDKEKGDAYVLTNCHVIYNDATYGSHYANTVYLYLYGQDEDYNDDDNRFNATVVGASITYDVALLKVTGSELLKNSAAEAATFAREEDIYLGEEVYTIGNAEGCGMSATRGFVTKDRESVPLNISTRYENSDGYVYYSVLRTDAAINEGNSGGALFNRAGKIVGLINSKTAENGIEGMGYAIPASAVKRLYPLMRESYEKNGSLNTRFDRAHFVVENDFSKAEKENEYVKSKIEVKSTGSSSTWDSENNRFVINEKISVVRDCNGLKAGDLITHVKITDGSEVVEDMDVTRLYRLQDTLLSARQGNAIIFTVQRGDATENVTANMAFSQFD